MGAQGRNLGEHWIPSTACRIMRCISRLEATFVPLLFPMNFVFLFRADRIYIPPFARPKRAEQQNYIRRQSRVVIFIVWWLLV